MDDVAGLRALEAFAQDRLVPDLEAARARLHDTEEELRDAVDLARWIRSREAQQQPQQPQAATTSAIETLVDVGMRVYAPARVVDGSRLLVQVGLGFYLEMPLSDAACFVEAQRIPLLRAQHTAALRAVARVTATLSAILQGIEHLKSLQLRS
jgi:prefoldin subunit 5